MRTLNRTHLGLAGALALLLLGSPAVAQSAADTIAVAPNILLLVDTSGSMEWKSTGDVDPVCNPTTPNTASSCTSGGCPNEKSRWIELLEVLTGTIRDYSCYAQPRTGPEFLNEFSLLGTAPYDLCYAAPYHRPMSNECAPAPGDVPWFASSPFEFNTATEQAMQFRPFTGSVVSQTSNCTTFQQARDGLIDTFDGLVRFGLMTFDTNANPGKGYTGAITSASAAYADGIAGGWTYVSNPAGCNKVDTGSLCSGCCLGTPWDCAVDAAFDVGARNGAAPPWEGRMVTFGPSSSDGTSRNAEIQQILLATRPFGATPIAGMLSDARDFLWHDTSDDPRAPSTKLSPYANDNTSADPLVRSGCRENMIILLTDGQPNMDLRPACVNGSDDDACPYHLPDDIVEELANATDKPEVRTFVVGFALGTATGGADGGSLDCEMLRHDDPICASPPDPATQACCTLSRIAFYGTHADIRTDEKATCDDPPCPLESHAYFPKTPSELRRAFAEIVGSALTRVTSRTFPVTATAGSAGGTNKGYEIGSGTTPSPLGLWKGKLTRSRIQCTNTSGTLAPEVLPLDPGEMDDFIANVNADPDDRRLFTVEPEDAAGARFATRSIRPYYDDTADGDDGIGEYGGAIVPFDDSLQGETLDFTPSLPTWCSSEAGCVKSIVEWAAGKTTASPYTRCAVPGSADCNVIADIFHSVPQVRPGRPTDFLRDDTYATFSSALTQRDTALYTSSNDGFFHAFLLEPGDPTDDTRKIAAPNNFNNELWAFVPPAVLPELKAMYPEADGTLNRMQVLDGVPVLMDVGATQGGTDALESNCATDQCYPFRLERKAAPATNETHTWRTVMVQSFGSQRSGYFALDVTHPTIPETTDTSKGPKFLWQLTTDAAGQPLFGRGGSTPLITTLYIGGKQVAVAVLAGGRGDPVGPAPCDAPTGAPLPIRPGVQGSPEDSTELRANVCPYPDSSGSLASTAARSLTIVRLDTGAIIRTFRPNGLALPSSIDPDVVIDTTRNQDGAVVPLRIPAPIVGQPVAYPSQVGQIADRIFVGDAEGQLWRIDVSSDDPDDWVMNVFFDTFYDQDVTAGTPPSQPISMPPVLSVDDRGQITVAYSTGDQDNLVPDANHENYIVSVTETFDRAGTVATDGSRKYAARLNWRQTLADGERVLGPMTLFNRTLYLSTYRQNDGANGCSDPGVSRVLSLNYVRPADTADATGGGFPDRAPMENIPGVVSGVGLRQLPSCGATVTQEDNVDEFLGYGQYTTSTTASTPGKFQLVIQLGGGTGTGSGTGTVPTQVVDLDPPANTVRIDSWAPIVE